MNYRKYLTIAALFFSGAMAESEYKVRGLKFGETDEINLNDFGVITNPFTDDIEEEIRLNDHLALIYVVDSKELKPKMKDSIASKIHSSVVQKGIEDMKGFLKVYVFDCDHPIAVQHIEDETDFYRNMLYSCGAHNE